MGETLFGLQQKIAALEVQKKESKEAIFAGYSARRKDEEGSV